jgi:hypothetical protein
LWKEEVWPDQYDRLFISQDYFYRFDGIHYDLENEKIAFSGGHDYRPAPPDPDPQPEPGPDPVPIPSNKVLIIVLSVVGGVLFILITTGIVCYIKRRKLKTRLESDATLLE